MLLIVAGVLFYGMELASHGGRKLLGQQTSGADLSLPLWNVGLGGPLGRWQYDYDHDAASSLIIRGAVVSLSAARLLVENICVVGRENVLRFVAAQEL